MSQKPILLCALLMLWGPGVAQVYAQRGVGDPQGVAQQAVRPEVVTLEGTVVEVQTGPCENTTGHAWIGTHVVLKTADGQQLNVHLGPAGAGQVAFLADALTAGLPVKVRAFRTAQLKEGHYVAQAVTYGDDRTVQLRDDNLRPAWAGGRGGGGGLGPGAGGWGMGPGAGMGRGRGAGGWGMGPGAGMGRGRGAGFGYGNPRGWGQGRGYGAGPGRGPRW